MAFTHVAESVLDRIRAHQPPSSRQPGAVPGSLRPPGALIDGLAAGEAPDDAITARSTALTARLQAVPTGGRAWRRSPGLPKPPDPLSPGCRRCRMRAPWPAGRGTCRCGRGLICCVTAWTPRRSCATWAPFADRQPETVIGGVPPLSALDPGNLLSRLRLSFDQPGRRRHGEWRLLGLRGRQPGPDHPAHGPLDDYRALFRDLPEDKLLLGEMLVRCGSLTADGWPLALRTRRPAPKPARSLASFPADRRGASSSSTGGRAEDAVSTTSRKPKARAGEPTLIGWTPPSSTSSSTWRAVYHPGAGAQPGGAAGQGARAWCGSHRRAIAAGGRCAIRRSTCAWCRSAPPSAVFRRVVRGRGRRAGQGHRADIRGGETELDKTVVEKIGDPLMHIVRNALDHGIEPADVRAARGKPRQAGSA